MKNVEKFMKKFIGVDDLTDEEIELYELAFTHSSNCKTENNQRLAFLGDSVLRLIVREHLYMMYPGWTRGNMSALAGGTNTPYIGIEEDENYARLAIQLKMIEHMDIANQIFDDDNKTVNAELFEAVFGAIYITRGYDEVKRLAQKHQLINMKSSIMTYTDNGIPRDVIEVNFAKNKVVCYGLPTEEKPLHEFNLNVNNLSMRC